MRVESELLFLSCSGPMYLSVPIKEETWRDRLCSPLSRDDTVGAALIVPPVAAAAKAFHGRARPDSGRPSVRIRPSEPITERWPSEPIALTIPPPTPACSAWPTARSRARSAHPSAERRRACASVFRSVHFSAARFAIDNFSSNDLLSATRRDFSQLLSPLARVPSDPCC